MEILKDLIKAGGTPYLVGGYVRDLFTKEPNKDIDIECYGLTFDQMAEALQQYNPKLVGSSFGVLAINGYDVSLPRKERSTGSSHTDFTVDFDPFMDKKEAASRRDFTMNSIMMDADGTIIDYFGGVSDITNKVIRHVNDDSFIEDPLRVLRAVQFATRFNMKLAPETAELCQNIDLSTLPIERVFEELRKLLVKGKFFISSCIDAFNDAGLWRLPPFHLLYEMWDTPQDPIWHPEGDVLTHTMHALQYASDNLTFSDDGHKFMIMLAILLHDVGKPICTEEIGGRITHREHAKLGADIARLFLGAVTNDTELITNVPKLVYNHMFPLDEAEDKAIRRLTTRVEKISDLLLVMQADKGERLPNEVFDKINNLGVMNTKVKRLVEYRDLNTDIQPPEERGKVINRLFEAQLDGLFTTKEEGIRFYESRTS